MRRRAACAPACAVPAAQAQHRLLRVDAARRLHRRRAVPLSCRRRSSCRQLRLSSRAKPRPARAPCPRPPCRNPVSEGGPFCGLAARTVGRARHLAAQLQQDGLHRVLAPPVGQHREEARLHGAVARAGDAAAGGARVSWVCARGGGATLLVARTRARWQPSRRGAAARVGLRAARSRIIASRPPPRALRARLPQAGVQAPGCVSTPRFGPADRAAAARRAAGRDAAPRAAETHLTQVMSMRLVNFTSGGCSG